MYVAHQRFQIITRFDVDKLFLAYHQPRPVAWSSVINTPCQQWTKWQTTARMRGGSENDIPHQQYRSANLQQKKTSAACCYTTASLSAAVLTWKKSKSNGKTRIHHFDLIVCANSETSQSEQRIRVLLPLPESGPLTYTAEQSHFEEKVVWPPII